jgi:carbonic anhydrase
MPHPRHLPPRLALLALLPALLAAGSAAAQAPQLKPMRLGTSEPAAGRAATPAASAAEAAPAAAPHDEVDPLEVLRQRLAGRLARHNAPSGGAAGANPYDLKIVARTSPPPAPAAPARATAPVAARSGGSSTPSARSAAAAGTPQGLPWTYAGPTGAPAWASLKPEYALCGNGQRQSPVDLRGGLPVDLEPVRFAYQPGRFSVLDHGRGLQVNLSPGSHIEIAGRRYELQHASFHRPSEHRIDGRVFEMSLHLVHRDAEGQTAIVALQIDPGPPQSASQLVLNHLPLEKRAENPGRAPLDPANWLPADHRYYTYMGSLTAPPCTEGVQWVVMREPVTLSREQLDLFARLYPMNARALQQLAGRRILQSQ